MKKLIYVMDPHCGWCYGNSDNFARLQKEFREQFDFEVLVGGMWVGANAPAGGEGLSRFINQHSPRMERITGAYVGKRFYDLTGDSSYVFSSLEPCAAIVLVKQIEPAKYIRFIKAVQEASFAEGMRLDQIETYEPILKEMGIDFEAFQKGWMTRENIVSTKTEFEDARKLASGYPTLLIESESDTEVVTSGYFNYDLVAETLKKELN